MKNIVNMAFIVLFLASPFVYAWHIPQQTAGAVVIGFLIAALLLADWYHFHITDTYINCLRVLLVCGAMSATIFVIFIYLYGFTPFQEPGLIAHSGWARSLFRVLVTGLGLICVSIVSLPRIAILRAMKRET